MPQTVKVRPSRINLAQEKPVSLGYPLEVIKTFSGFKSLNATPWACKCSKAKMIPAAINLAVWSSKMVRD